MKDFTYGMTLESDLLVLGGYEERVVLCVVSGVIATQDITMDGISRRMVV